MDGKLPSLFSTLPRQPYGVEPVPADIAPKYTAGRYNGSPPEGSEPGSTGSTPTRSSTRPLYNLEALTLHEAVPGHHLQIALADELRATCPTFRRFSYISALRRGLGPLLRVARPRGGLLHRSLQQLRPADVRDVARLPPGRRHGHARRRAGPASSPSTTSPPTPPCRSTSARPRPTATSAGPARPSSTRSASSRSASFAPAPSRRSAPTLRRRARSTTRCSRTARCRCRCWNSRSTRSSRRNRRADARPLSAFVNRLSAFVPSSPGSTFVDADSRSAIRGIRVTRNASRPARLSCSGRVRPRATKIGRCCSYGMHSAHVVRPISRTSWKAARDPRSRRRR